MAMVDSHAARTPYPMKFRLLVLLALFLTAALPARPAALAGKWLSEFDSQIGVQKYVFEFKQDGDHLTGEATHDHSLGKGTAQLKNIKVDGDKVSFDEPFELNGTAITITYSGTLASDEMKLTRNVGDFATEQIAAKRAPAQK
jgi:hypothetical protein